MAEGSSKLVGSAWDARLSTGVSLLDEQHIALFDCLQYLERATAQKAMLATFHAMEQLSRYVRDHFSAEEHLMKVSCYPGLAEHVNEHRVFCDKLFELRKTYLDHDISSDLIDFLRAWLEQHVAQTDMAYVPYLKGHRVDADACAALAPTPAGRPQDPLEW